MFQIIYKLLIKPLHKPLYLSQIIHAMSEKNAVQGYCSKPFMISISIHLSTHTHIRLCFMFGEHKYGYDIRYVICKIQEKLNISEFLFNLALNLPVLYQTK